MAVVCRGTSDIQGHDSWRIPFGLFFVVPTLVACGVWFTDEVWLDSPVLLSAVPNTLHRRCSSANHFA
jgi:hypothetical protein